MRIIVNGKPREAAQGLLLKELLQDLSIPPQGSCAEINGEIVNPSLHGERRLAKGDSVEILRMMGGGSGAKPPLLSIAGRSFHSRLFIGTGKFSSPQIMAQAVQASGSEMATVALRRVDLNAPGRDSQLEALAPLGLWLLPNTAGARDAGEALRLARLGRVACGTEWVKLEVTPDPETLLPDSTETLKAAEALLAEGFVVLPYISADPVLARRLADAGCAAVMPLAAPIGTGRGLLTRALLEMIIAQATVPVVVDAGLGLPSHAAAAIEMGADAVLVNTAIAAATDPVGMARAFSLAVQAAELGRRSGPMAESAPAASSPLEGLPFGGEA